MWSVEVMKYFKYNTVPQYYRFTETQQDIALPHSEIRCVEAQLWGMVIE